MSHVISSFTTSGNLDLEFFVLPERRESYWDQSDVIYVQNLVGNWLNQQNSLCLPDIVKLTLSFVDTQLTSTKPKGKKKGDFVIEIVKAVLAIYYKEHPQIAQTIHETEIRMAVKEQMTGCCIIL